MGSMAEILARGLDFRYDAISIIRYEVCKVVFRLYSCLVPFEKGAGRCEENPTG